MPTDRDQSEEQRFDPLEQPPLVRRREGSTAEEAEAATEPAPAETDAVKVSAGARRVKPRGRFLGFLGLLAGLAGLGAAGYLYYLLIYLQPETRVDSRIDGLADQLAGTTRAVEELERTQARALGDLADQERRAREALTKQVLESVNTLATQAPPSTREWKIAELAYLLRIANHRVLMERDAQGALTLLQAADAILQELDDFALFQVRAQLADEIQALENVEAGELQGVFLRIEALKTEIGRARVKLPHFEEAPAAAAPEEPGLWAALLDQIGRYLRFRRFEGEGVRPLLAPEEAAYLELNLRLMLEQAQLAALRAETTVYQQSLQTAASWIATYLDKDDPAVARSLDEIEALSIVVLDEPLPDISGSLNALRALGEA
ncbi:MAG TPA: uroporphyrinogen-III C-methyltransferase [Pseudomonadales bacterium]